MSIERVFYCDWRECNHHMQTDSTSAAPFITVTGAAGRSLHFCDWDCLLKYAGEIPPTRVLSRDSAD
jgi:hypothetical protein